MEFLQPYQDHHGFVQDGQDEHGDIKELEFSGMTARCFQHEYDHLQGILFIDHLSRLKLERAMKKKNKREKQYARAKRTIYTNCQRTLSQTIPNCLTKEQCKKLIKYHKINFNLVTHTDASEQYNGRRIPMVSIRNLEVKRILAEYQYKAISEIWKVYGQRAYPEQSELMWWTIW